MFFIGPISTRRRDKAMTALIRKGSATDDQIFEAQYGEWPVRGLNKDTACPDIVHFQPFHKDRKLNVGSYIFSPAYTRQDDMKREIFLNRPVLNPLGPLLGMLTTRLAYARIHDVAELLFGVRMGPLGPVLLGLSLMSSYRFAVISSFSRMLAPSVADLVGEEHIHVKQFKEGRKVTTRKAFQAVADDLVRNRPPLEKGWIQIKQGLDMILSAMPLGYFSSDHELQARVHNIMVRGYKAWGRLPEDAYELSAALNDMGIKTPRVMADFLAEPQQEPLRKIFNKHALEGYFGPPSAEMNLGLNSHRSAAVLDYYWQHVLPFLYADLLRMYGDSNAYQRFGYSGDFDMMGLPVMAPRKQPDMLPGAP